MSLLLLLFLSTVFVAEVFFPHLLSEFGLLSSNLRLRPNPNLQNPLKFLSGVVPSVIVAEPVRRQVIVNGMATTTAVG